MNIARFLPFLLAALLFAGPIQAQVDDPPEGMGLEELLAEDAMQILEDALRLPEIPQRRVPQRKSTAGFKCFPTCSATDGRFLALANGSQLLSLSEPNLKVRIGVPAGTASFVVGVFDGDSGKKIANGASRWDQGYNTSFTYRLLADPKGDGTGTAPVELQPGKTAILSATLANDGWSDFTVATSAAAQAPSGNYFYTLQITLDDPKILTLNSLKLRTSAQLTIDLKLFSYIPNYASLEDIQVLYPKFPDLAPTTYDGTFVFYFEMPADQNEVVVWGGDFDYGKWDRSTKDTDDPDTPNAPFLPPWATSDAVPEGIAVGLNGATGSPPDDNSPAGTAGPYMVRPPSLRWDLVFPGGQVFANNNPSGNREWEQFRIARPPFDRNLMDGATDQIPHGVYGIVISGVDLQNLNAIRTPYRALCVDDQGTPCYPVLKPYLLGDTVFQDRNADGVQNAGENGIAGVRVQLLSAAGTVIGEAETDSRGNYRFEVEPGNYRVVVAAENFELGALLAGMIPTTAMEMTASVSNANVLTLNFGLEGIAGTPGACAAGIWLDHPDVWPLSGVTVGGGTYSSAQAMSLLRGSSARGNAAYALWMELLAAKLNVAAGNPQSCVRDTIAAADAWFTANPLGGSASCSAISVWWATLSQYNNGLLCAGECNGLCH